MASIKPKIFRNESTPEGKVFWNGVEKAAAIARDFPYWKRVGLSTEDFSHTESTIKYTEQEFKTLFDFAFSDQNPGYKSNIIESPNGDNIWDNGKRYAHIAPKYINDLNNIPEVKRLYEQARVHAVNICNTLGVPKQYYPGTDSTLRILHYPSGATTAPHTDFNLFTICMYRNLTDTFKYLSAEDDEVLNKARSMSAGIHFGELMTEILGVPATKHEVIASDQEQFSAVFFVVPEHKVMLPSGQLISEWITERKSRSRKEI